MEITKIHKAGTALSVQNAWSYTSTAPYVFLAWSLVRYRIVFMAWYLVKHRDLHAFPFHYLEVKTQCLWKYQFISAGLHHNHRRHRHRGKMTT